MWTGSFDATVLITTDARQGGRTSRCEGRGQITGIPSGLNLTWTGGSIAYDNCPGLTISSQAQAVAVSPIPDASPNRASLVITVLGGATVQRGTCASSIAGYPFTVEMSETAGINVSFDSQFRIEERRNTGVGSSTTLDMPISGITGGTRRTFATCSPPAGTYQALFRRARPSGNRVRLGRPRVTLAPLRGRHEAGP